MSAIRASHGAGDALNIRRVRAHLPLLVSIAGIIGAALHAQQAGSVDDVDKRRDFLKAREEMRTVPATPPPEASPRPKPKPKPATPEPEATPKPKPKPEPEATPKTKPKPEPEVTPRPKPQTPRPVTPAPETPPRSFKSEPKWTKPDGQKPDDVPPAAVTIEKTDIKDVQPAPPAGWWDRWKFLTRAIRAEIDRAPVRKNRWRYIVVHNSGTRQGNARAFDHYHRFVRRMQNGLAYHFVIGNGTSSGDGEIEIGGRWVRQINGGHVHSDYLNNIALGICLVGDFNRDVPTTKQLAALEELIRYLRQRVGKVDGKWSIVKAHREINPPRWPTDCPGDRFPYRWLHGKFD